MQPGAGGNDGRFVGMGGQGPGMAPTGLEDGVTGAQGYP